MVESVCSPEDMESDHSDSTYNPQEDMSSDARTFIEKFVEDWVLSLDREDTISLGIFLTYHLVHLLNFTNTKAAEYAGITIGKADRTIR